MQTISTYFEQELTKLVAEQQERLTQEVLFGAAIVDYAQYRHVIGKIAGLQLVIDMFEDVNTAISKR